MIFIFDRDLNLLSVEENSVLENLQTEELNGLITANVKLIYNRDLENAVYFGQKEDNNFYIFKIRKQVKEDGTISFDGIHLFYDELRFKIIREIRPQNKTVHQIVTQMFEGTAWEVEVSGDLGTHNHNAYFESVLSSTLSFLKEIDCEFKPIIEFSNNQIQKKYLKIQKNLSTNKGKIFEYGSNLISVTAETSYDSIATGYIGLGKSIELSNEDGQSTVGYSRKIRFDDVEWKIESGKLVNKPIGQDFVEIVEATQLYSSLDNKPKLAVVEFGNIEDKEELLQATYEFALENARPKIQFAAKGLNNERVEIGEIVSVVHPELNIRYQTKIFKIHKDFTSNTVSDFEFGERIVQTMTDRLIQSEVKTKKQINEITSVLTSRIENINLDFLLSDGFPTIIESGNEFGLPPGFYVFDKPLDQNSTSLVAMAGNGIVIANEKDSEGNWIITTAIDGNGIVGSSIIANSITANQLSADVGQSLDLSSNESVNIVVQNSIIQPLEDIHSQLHQLTTNQTTLEQTSEDFTIAINQINQLITENKELADSDWEFLRTYFVFNSDGLVVGKNSNSMKLNITNDKMSFEDNGNEVAYFSNEKLYVYSGHFINDMTIGTFEFVPRTSGNLTFRKVRG